MVQLSSSSDEEYIWSIQNNDQSAIRELYAAHYSMVFRFVLNNSGTEHDAKDIYQEAFIILVRNIKNDHFRKNSSIKTYLYSICRKLWLKELQMRTKISGIKIDDMDVFEELDEQDEKDIVAYEQKFLHMDKCLKELGEPCRTIINDFYIHKKSMQVIAENMGYSNAENAKNQKYKCFKRLKKMFFKTGSYDTVQAEFNR